jgi:periplasmic divalent cation tolerance protein
MTDKRLVLTTCGSPDEAKTIAQALVERQLAACVNIVPQVQSVYRWQGKVETATEFLLIIKTTAGAFKELRNAVAELHSYDVPECVEIAIEDGNAEYLDWIDESVKLSSRNRGLRGSKV